MLLFSRKKMLLLPLLKTMEAPENGHVGIKVFLPGIVAGSIALLKYIYTKAWSKQEEMEATVQRENDDIVMITESQRDDSDNWSAAMDGC